MDSAEEQHLAWLARSFGRTDYVPLTSADLAALSDAGSYVEKYPGTHLFKEGADSEAAYVIRTGDVELSRSRRSGRLVVGRVGPGAVIGDIADDEMEVGMGQHGEGGGGIMKLATADETAQIMLDKLLNTMDVQSGDKLLVVVNGSGATTLMEQYIVLRGVKKQLDEKGIELARSMVGEFLTVQEMGGFQMCVAKMDDELIAYFDAPCDTPAYTVK